MNHILSGNSIDIKFKNGLCLNLPIDKGYVKGIEKVLLTGKSLRSCEECITPEIATPYGMEVDKYEFIDIYEADGAVVVRTKPYFKVGHRMEWAEHALHLRINTSSWSQGSKPLDNGLLEWIIKEENESFDGEEYCGFSYGFRYHCPGQPIYQIEDKATWELGGNACGNTIIMRGSFNKPVAHLETDTYYYTGWDLPGIPNPHVFQHLPLYAQLQGFTFQFDKEHVLLTVHEKPSHVRSLFLKEKGDSKLLHFNQFCFDLTDRTDTPARRIMVSKRASDSFTDLVNHYLRVKDKIHESIYGYYGIKLDSVRPSAHVETWNIAKAENFSGIFEQLHKWNIKRAFVMPFWKSNETEIKPKFSERIDDFGFFGNMCCPLELEIADCYGGWDGLKKILSKAVELGIETYSWFGSHFSSLSPLRKRMKNIFARDVSGQFNRNNYGHVLYAVNQNSQEYQEYLFDRFKKARDCGLNGLFRDSHTNMAADTINYLHIPYEKEVMGGATADRVGFLESENSQNSDMILSMHDTEVRIQKRFQEELGMFYYVESIGILGTPMCGTNYDLVRGYEYIFSNVETNLNCKKLEYYGDDVSFVYFRGLSVKLVYQLNIEVNKFPYRESLDPWWSPDTMVPMLQGYSTVESHMTRMYLLEDDRGILWRDGDIEVVFAYKDFSYRLAGKRKILETIGNQSFEAENAFEAEKMKIYLIK